MSTIKQKTAVVSVENGPRIEVRRMRWKPAKLFFKKLGAVIAVAYASGEKNFMAKLPDIIESSDELSTILCTQSTDLTVEQLDDLDHLVAAEVLRRAIEVNCDDEVKNCYAGIGATVRALMSANQTTS